MKQLELFESALDFAVHLSVDELRRVRAHNYEGFQRIAAVRNLINRMAWLSRHESYGLMPDLNRRLEQLLHQMTRQMA